MPAITKATIATIAAAVVPMTFLIQKNKSISHELDALRQQIATAPPHPAPAPLPAPAAPPAATLETDGPELPADSQSSDPQDNTDPIASAVADLFSSDALVQTFKDGARRNVKRELTQLKLRLKLTDSQEATLREFLEEQQSGELRVVQKLVQTGALKRLMKNPDDPQPEDIASLKELETESKNRPNRDEFIESILTAGQRTEYAKYREERRIADAEQTAQQALDDIAGTVDLTPDQKDRLFQALAQRELKKPRPAATDSTKSIVSDLIHFGPEDGDSSDEILKQHLTPEQFEALQGSRRDDAGNEGPSR